VDGTDETKSWAHHPCHVVLHFSAETATRVSAVLVVVVAVLVAGDGVLPQH
jgi:hypothetical protein